MLDLGSESIGYLYEISFLGRKKLRFKVMSVNQIAYIKCSGVIFFSASCDQDPCSEEEERDMELGNVIEVTHKHRCLTHADLKGSQLGLPHGLGDAKKHIIDFYGELPIKVVCEHVEIEYTGEFEED